MKAINQKDWCFNQQTRQWEICKEPVTFRSSPGHPAPVQSCCQPQTCCIQCKDMETILEAIKLANTLPYNPSSPWNLADGFTPTGNEFLQWVKFQTGVDIRFMVIGCFVNPDINFNTGLTPSPGSSIIQSLGFEPNSAACDYWGIAWEYEIGGSEGYRFKNIKICIDPNQITSQEVVKCRQCTQNNQCRCLGCLSWNGMLNFVWVNYINSTMSNVYQQGFANQAAQMFIDTGGQYGIDNTDVRPGVGSRMVSSYTSLCAFIETTPASAAAVTANDSTEYYVEIYNVYVEVDQQCPFGASRLVNIGGKTYATLALYTAQESSPSFSYIYSNVGASQAVFDPAGNGGNGSFEDGFCNF